MIGYQQRVVAVGMNRSGKSEILRYLWSQLRCRRVLVDPKGEWQVAGAPLHRLQAQDEATARAEVAALPWAEPIVHVRPAWHGSGNRQARAQLQALYARIALLPGACCTWTDEGYGVSSSNWCPPGLSEILVAGAARGHGHLAAFQRPRNVAVELLSEADHLFVVPPLTGDDLAHVLTNGAPFVELGEARRLVAELPRHGYLYVDRREQRLLVGDPLPEWMRQANRAKVGKVGEPLARRPRSRADRVGAAPNAGVEPVS